MPPEVTRAPALAAIRQREFPITDDWLYFDTASYGPHPRRYVQTLADVAHKLSVAPLGTTASGIDDVRIAAARLLHAPVDNVALLRSTGEGINLVAAGLAWQPGDEVIVYELDFPSLLTPWLALKQRGVNVIVVADEGRNRFDARDFERLVTPRTRAIAVSLVINTTGFRTPVESLAELCRARGLWFTVDAVQAVGSFDVDAPALGADVVSGHGYKFLLSGFGCAVAYFSDRALQELAVPHVGSSHLQPAEGTTLFDADLRLSANGRRFEPSVPNLPAVLAMGQSIELLLEAGPQPVGAHNRALCARLVDALAGKGYTIVTSQAAGESAGLVCFSRPSTNPDEIREHLYQRHIVTAVRGGNLRVAPHLFNTPDEVDQLIQELP